MELIKEQLDRGKINMPEQIMAQASEGNRKKVLCLSMQGGIVEWQVKYFVDGATDEVISQLSKIFLFSMSFLISI